MELKGAVLCVILTLLSTTSSFYSKCPAICICLSNFTDCKFNHLTDLPEGLDPNVTVLDLAYNDFHQLPFRLSLYGSLVYLNLSNNYIQSLRSSNFHNLDKLERLDLTHNLLDDWTKIRSDTFSSTKKLVFLDLSHNPLRSLSKQNKPFQISSLQILRLNNCSIDHLSNQLLATLPNLQELHLSDNPIKYLQVSLISLSLKFVDLSRCNLQHISPGVFSGLTSLQTIYMNYNPQLTKFNCDSTSLRFLDLSHCNLGAVPGGNLPSVYRANFHGNHFRAISETSFRNYSKLEILDLSYNAISEISKNAFTGLKAIERIDLSQNPLPDLGREVFYTNENLKFVNLSKTYTSKFQSFFSDSLESLDLSSCEIPAVDYDSLENMPSLKILNLSKNRISVLPDNWQGDNLVSLDVSLCRIKNVNNRTFALMSSLRNLNLAGNRLTGASPESFAQVVSLDISDNPWRCDCSSLKDLYDWLYQTGKRMEGLYCQSPDKYEGMSWLSVCGKEWHPDLTRSDTVWWYTTGLIVTVFFILLVILIMRRMYLLKEKRLREADLRRRSEEREALRRMQRREIEERVEESRNAPDPRELQRPPSYNEALLLPTLDSSHPSLSGSLHSIASKYSINGSLPDVSKRTRPRRKRRRRKSESSEGQRASRVVIDSETSDPDGPQPRATLESDF